MRLAYLCNVYPAVSHSFVRREIEAVEGAGNEVHRFSVRQPGTGLKDPADLREAERTRGCARARSCAASRGCACAAVFRGLPEPLVRRWRRDGSAAQGFDRKSGTSLIGSKRRGLCGA